MMSRKSQENDEKNAVESRKGEHVANQSTSQSERSVFDPDVITEADIDRIWATMQKQAADDQKYRRKRELNLASTDTTPTTDYNGIYFAIQPETLEEELDLDRKKSKMDEVLRVKRAQPKTYLTQVILYDNVSHERLLHQKLQEIRNRHKVVEKKIKRRKETFIQKLESKQNEWTRLDARVTKKFEPENMPDLSFKFGQLYHRSNYPYQAAINSLRGVQALKPQQSRAIRILPQVTRRKVRKNSEQSNSESSTTDIFVTRLPKKQRTEKDLSSRYTDELMTRQKDKASWGRMEQSIPITITENFRPVANTELPPLRGQRGHGMRSEKNWMEDARYLTLTSLLGERFSPKKKFRSHVPAPNIA